MDVRLDDFGYNSDFSKWVKIVKKLRERGVKKIVIAIIPFDSYFGSKVETEKFLKAITELNCYNVEWSLHGYCHDVSPLPNLNYLSPIAKKGEFFGDSMELFVEKLGRGLAYLRSLNLVISSYSPPNHYITLPMLDAINENFYPEISKVYHGVGHFHCRYKNLEIITWRSPKMNEYRSNCVGFICLHPETMSSKDIDLLDAKEYDCTKDHRMILMNSIVYRTVSSFFFVLFYVKRHIMQLLLVLRN